MTVLAARAGLLRVKGQDLHVTVEGGGPPLLLLNGFARPLSSWDSFVAGIVGRTVIRLDLPGAGESPWPVVPQTTASLAGLVAMVLEELGVDSLDVVGFSQGGRIAQQLAFDFANTVRLLVLASTTCGWGATVGRWPGNDWSRRFTSMTRWPAVAGLWSEIDAPVWSSVGFLGSLRQPTLVVCGTEDEVTPPLNSKVLADRIADATLALVPGGHDLQDASWADGFSRVVAHFLEERGSSLSASGSNDSMDEGTWR